MSQQVILDALSRSGITGDNVIKKNDKKITKTDFFTLGLSGNKNSSHLRDSLAEYLKLPRGISANAFLDCVNAVYEYNEFIKAVRIWQQEEDKK